LRQGNIALIHSAPTGESENPVCSARFVMPGLVPGIHVVFATAHQDVDGRDI
jgi:hypothetical protein